MYKLEKYVDGEWWPWGTYRTVQSLAAAAFELGKVSSADKIRVTEVQE